MACPCTYCNLILIGKNEFARETSIKNSKIFTHTFTTSSNPIFIFTLGPLSIYILMSTYKKLLN